MPTNLLTTLPTTTAIAIAKKAEIVDLPNIAVKASITTTIAKIPDMSDDNLDFSPSRLTLLHDEQGKVLTVYFDA